MDKNIHKTTWEKNSYNVLCTLGKLVKLIWICEFNNGQRLCKKESSWKVSIAASSYHVCWAQQRWVGNLYHSECIFDLFEN